MSALMLPPSARLFLGSAFCHALQVAIVVHRIACLIDLAALQLDRAAADRASDAAHLQTQGLLLRDFPRNADRNLSELRSRSHNLPFPEQSPN
jgi:hypothetical protein